MTKLRLSRDLLQLQYGDTAIDFLPKEFFLLSYLWDHRDQTLSREQLLDAVWRGEEPVDRTVDDHVYRIRRKLQRLQGAVSIGTVRGAGYRLQVRDQTILPEANLLLEEPQLREHVRHLFRTYHLHGHGQAIRHIASNPELFGIQYDEYLEFIAHHIQGDFIWVIEHGEKHFDRYCFTLLGTYNMIQYDADKSLRFYHQALEKVALPADDRNEIECFDLTQLYAQLGRMDDAMANQAQAEARSEKENWEGYLPALYLLGAVIAAAAGDMSLTHEKIVKAEAFLATHPWRRELATLSIVKALVQARCGDSMKAVRLMDEGLSIYEEIGFTNQLVLALHRINWLMEVWSDCLSAQFKKHYQDMWHGVVEKYQLQEIESRLYSLLERQLF